MSDQAFHNWYENHKSEFNAKRRARYRRDRAYRKRVQGYTRRNRKAKPSPAPRSDGGILAKVNGKVEVGYRMGAASKILNLPPDVIRYLEKRGYIPVPKKIKGKRYVRIYTVARLELVRLAYETRQGVRFGNVSKQEAENVKLKIKEEW